MTPVGAPPVELWGGAECTVNRVGDCYLDQVKLTGHQDRLDDLDLFAGLGIRTLRYPVLWERVAPHGLQHARWSWTDERLERIRALGMGVIAGLVHHGSGPPNTSLVDPDFPEQLAHFAQAVALRYPWIDRFTPVNEPLTTARFSGLYGHWYPHGRDDRTFVRCLLTQCRAVVLSMQAIRTVTPHAELVQTDDLGHTSSTPALHYQAEYENERRWITFDLLSGRVTRDHPLWGWLTGPGGASGADLEWFVERPCPPDVLGINHYLSSERYLDQDLLRYPEACHGRNGRHEYADELTARVRAEGAHGPLALLREAWERYSTRIAVTETHNGCTREEQMRWFLEVWRAAEAARDEGIEVSAVTAWSLLGVHGWDRLVTGGGRYEPGVFDLRATSVRPTAMVSLLRRLAAGQTPGHPLLDVPGWWRRPDRHIHGFARTDDGELTDEGTVPGINHRHPTVRPLLIVGTGGLRRALGCACERRGIPYRLLMSPELSDPVSLRGVMTRFKPWAAVIVGNDAGMEVESGDGARCCRGQVSLPVALADDCSNSGSALLAFPSALALDGLISAAYLQDLSDAALDLLIDAEPGIWHLTDGCGARSDVRGFELLPHQPRVVASTQHEIAV